MAAYQKQALSNGHKSTTSLLKTEDSYQSNLSSGELDEFSNKEPWPLPAQRPSDCHSRPRSQSYRQSRLSISIPIAPRNGSIDSITGTPALAFSPLTSSPQIQPFPSDSNAFLVSLASQERYVFELREELLKAEKELKRLKRFWACHETSKKNGEIINMKPLRPISNSVTAEDDINNQGAMAIQKSEADKRKELLENFKNSKNSKEMRRTFSGNHARTLSLLSPEKSIFHQSKESKHLQDQKAIEISTLRKPLISKTNRIVTEPSYRVKNLYSPKNMTIGGKQLVDIAEDVKEGFKAGMLNFFEDLRQVTVGDESIIKNVTSKNTIINSLIDDSRSFAKTNQDKMDNKGNLIELTTSSDIHENLIDIHPQAQIRSDIKPEDNSLQNKSSKKNSKSKTLSLAIPTVDELDDTWSIWDSPITKSPRWSVSTTTSSLTTPPDSGFFDQDLKISGQLLEDSVPILNNGDYSWSAFKSLTSGGLRGNLQNAWCGVLKELEDSMVRQHNDRCEAFQQQKVVCDLSQISNETSTQEELLYMSR
ncbi:hypothetical protein OnM2_063030 [Erysiphe neolycopersici]|uniref:DUF4048 domain-containing protein n=1 Tax=Erysiphe neolycopersici TaxID=212602 RepID=A0A420HNG9_9PEZI|nr:hypothetical protein OnM2_063030 [Erysiphe neolycopersici]